MVAMARAAAVVVCVTILGCGQSTPEAKLLKDTHAAAGWVPALQATGEKWAANSVPRRFVQSAAEAAKKELEKTRTTIRKSNADAELRHRLERDFQSAHDVASVLESAAEKGDPRLLAGPLRELKRVHDDLESIRQRYGDGS